MIHDLQPVADNTADRDISLGRYMDAWSRLEVCLLFLTSELLSADYDAASAVFATLGSRQVNDLLNALAAIRLRPDGAQLVARICDRLRRLNTKRNHLVHGRWHIVATMRTDSFTAEWVRTYTPADPAIARQLGNYDTPKIRENYTFTVPQVVAAIRNVEALMLDVSKLSEQLPQLRLFSPPALPTET